jgi:hypothetical protein
MHCPRFKHLNVDALSRNLQGSPIEEDALQEHIYDMHFFHQIKYDRNDLLKVRNMIREGEGILSSKLALINEWLHVDCYFGINHDRLCDLRKKDVGHYFYVVG